MKKTKIILPLFFALMWISQAVAQDEFTVYSGIVSSFKSDEPIPTCYIYIKDADVGTVSNSSGEFEIRISNSLLNSTITFSSIGYASLDIPIRELSTKSNKISLKLESHILSPVEIRVAESIVKNAVKMIPRNYPTEEENLIAYYREIVQKNQKYVDLSQGILDINKAAYTSKADSKVLIKKGYRINQYSHHDSLAFKLQGGTNSMMLLDVVKNPGVLLSSDVLDGYKYEMIDLKELDGKVVYEISFEPKELNEDIRYSGLIYIDQRSMAIAKIKFGYGPEAVKTLGKDLVKKKPSFAILTPLQIDYEVSYQQSGNEWYLNHVKTIIAMRCNWKKRLFNKTFTATSEMATISRSKETSDLDYSKGSKDNHVFAEEIPKYYDSTFWENYSIIKPEEDILKALRKVEKKSS